MNKPFTFKPLDLIGAFLIEPFQADDQRGVFIKDYHQLVFKNAGIDLTPKEIFYTQSKKGVIRAIHFQSIKEQAKLVKCVTGKIFDVIVDLRMDSETFGQWRSFILSEQNQKQLYIPKHFGHGYLVLEPSIVSYMCDEVFHSEHDDGIVWNDMTLNINWPTDEVEEIILSDKDHHLQTFEMFLKKRNNI